MAKRSLQSVLAPKPAPEPASPVQPAEKPAKAPDTRMVTSLRISPEQMMGLKVLAVKQRKRVNEVIREAIDNHLALHQHWEAA